MPVEGFHALKHALRFGADVLVAVSCDLPAVLALADALAPDLADRLAALVRPVAAGPFAALSPRSLATPVLAVARRPAVDVPGLLRAEGAPVVLLDGPRYAGNAGAVVRVAAAAEAAGVLVSGSLDPWSAAVVRGAAGLHWALPVAAAPPLADVAAGPRPMVAFDPDGSRFDPAALPGSAVLVFGSERSGVGQSWLAAADLVVSLPMRPGVSSLNLATTVAAVLYAWRLLHPVLRQTGAGS